MCGARHLLGLRFSGGLARDRAEERQAHSGPGRLAVPLGAQYELACSTRALDNTVYLARANQPGVYPEASFDTPGGVYGPDGGRICRSVGAGSVTEVDVELPERWQSSFGSTPSACRNAGAPTSSLGV